jgi:hypothetical protein
VLPETFPLTLRTNKVFPVKTTLPQPLAGLFFRVDFLENIDPLHPLVVHWFTPQWTVYACIPLFQQALLA